MNQKNNIDIKSIGARFRSVRSLINMNRKEFCERHGINRYTLQSWENGLHVSKGKNVEKFIEALAKEGIACSVDWLIDGLGEPPRFFNKSTPDHTITLYSAQKRFSDEHEELIKEIKEIYENKGQGIVYLKVKDQSMSPMFNPHDTVIAIKIEKDEYLGQQKDCLVDLSSGPLILGRVFFLKEQFLLSAMDQSAPILNLNYGVNKIYKVFLHLLG